MLLNDQNLSWDYEYLLLILLHNLDLCLSLVYMIFQIASQIILHLIIGFGRYPKHSPLTPPYNLKFQLTQQLKEPFGLTHITVQHDQNRLVTKLTKPPN